MKKYIKLIGFIKNFLLLIPVTLLFYPLSKLMVFITYFNYILIWIFRNKKCFKYLEPLKLTRDYKNRYNLYKYISDNYTKENSHITYLEFGVAGGESLNWWIQANNNTQSKFYGFDTFEGLPEDWGIFFKKGDMSYTETKIQDTRVELIKGLFQDTLFQFIQDNSQVLNSSARKIIHMDADLYSSTLFVLSQLYPYLKSGDIILFDEFNVALHEFRAYKDFTESFYVELIPLGAVNNFLQVAFIVK